MAANPSAPFPRPHPTAAKLGTFAGVFTPSVLTILGIILFLRLGYIVGGAGLGRALMIIALANLISILTSVSLAAIATNLKVKGGGDYYLISRTLGLEFGGALGLILFLAQSVSIAFYCIGFGEAIAAMGFDIAVSPRITANLAILFLFGLAWLGADWATRFQFGVMAFLVLALASFGLGAIPRWDTAVLVQNWSAPSDGPAFWVLFALFFPAVTGFTQGVSMSGDLKDPAGSLPVGTFLAVGISIAVYFGVTVLFAGTLPNAALSQDYQAMKRVARFGLAIDAGVVAATLSSAMASFLGAPRILQSLAADRIFPFLNLFAIGSGPSNNPRRGVLLAGAIAVATANLGNLNLIAGLVAMFFLISYGLLNWATYFEARAQSPSFRPRIKWFDRRISLAGFVVCFACMLAIDLKTGIVAVAILTAIYQYLRHTAGPARWADSRRAYHLHQVRQNLLATTDDPAHPRDWRPQILAFSNDPQRRTRLLDLARWLEGRSGLTTVVQIVVAKGAKAMKLREDKQAELRRELSRHETKAFARVVAGPDFDTALYYLLQAFGIGPLQPNTILLNWINPDTAVSFGFRELLFGRQLKTIRRMGCNVAVLYSDETRWAQTHALLPHRRHIDIWWRDDQTGRLMLLLAYLTTRSEPWDEATLRVIVATPAAEAVASADVLETVLADARIDARPVHVELSLVEDDGAAQESDILSEVSGEAALVFLPFRLRGNLIQGLRNGPIENELSHLPTTVLVTAAQDIVLDAEPEEGLAGQRADARDALDDASKRARAAEKKARQAKERAQKAQSRLEQHKANSPSPTDGTLYVEKSAEQIKEVRSETHKLELEAERAMRRAAKARAKVAGAAKTAAQLDETLTVSDLAAEDLVQNNEKGGDPKSAESQKDGQSPPKHRE